MSHMPLISVVIQATAKGENGQAVWNGAQAEVARRKVSSPVTLPGYWDLETRPAGPDGTGRRGEGAT